MPTAGPGGGPAGPSPRRRGPGGGGARVPRNVEAGAGGGWRAGRRRGPMAGEQKQKIAEGVRRHWEQVDREELAFQERKAKTCSLCGEPGHQALYCPNASPEMQELLAEQQRRKAEKISRANKGAPRRKKTAEERAKISRAMKERYKDGRVRRVCKICGQPGHYAKTCPHREGAAGAGAGAGAEAAGEGGASAAPADPAGGGAPP